MDKHVHLGAATAMHSQFLRKPDLGIRGGRLWAQQADPCENLKSFKAASAEITKATLIPAGTTRRSPGDRAARRRFPHIASLRRDESPDGN